MRIASGNSEDDRICTSDAERQTLTIRSQVRRMTRLANAFSNKWTNRESALALFFAYDNFCRARSSGNTTPTMAAGLADHVWSIEELLDAMAGTGLRLPTDSPL